MNSPTDTNQASEVLQGDCLIELKKLDENSIDAVITDPPYGYSFMGKDWDKAVPSVEIWRECLRVLKPGGWCMVMSAPRSDVQNAMISRLMEAGFRLDFTPIYWTYASGFPKAGNIGKLVDKRLGSYVPGAVLPSSRNVEHSGDDADFTSYSIKTASNPQSPEAKALDGSYTGFQPKPAVEVIIVAMKPLSEKTYVDQALKNGKGITWLDDCRIPTKEGDTPKGGYGGMAIGIGKPVETQEYTGSQEANPQGRFPANLLVSDDVLNDGRVRKAGVNKEEKGTGGIWRKGTNLPIGPEYGDSGSYSRYFDLDAWAAAHLSEQQMKTFPFAIFPKASKSEKNKGLEHMEAKEAPVNEFRPTLKSNPENWKTLIQDTPYGGANRGGKAANNHPTVKPLKLMSYLITLTTREGDTVLDPFVGSGTTVVAAKQLGRKGIGIEREPEYAEIARARVDAAEERLRQGVLL